MNNLDLSWGQPISIHRPNIPNQVFKILMGSLVVYVFILVLQDQYYLEDVGTLIMQFVFLIIIGWSVIVPILRLAEFPRIEVYNNGLRRVSWLRQQEWVWDSFDSLKTTYLLEINFIPYLTVGAHHLYREKKQVIGITYNFTQMDTLVRNVLELSGKALLPRYLSQYDTDGEVRFGRIRLNREKIYSITQRAQLKDIQKYDVGANMLFVGRKDRFHSASFWICYVHNWHVLTKLLDLIIHTNETSAEAV